MPITVNGTAISDEEIVAAAEQFADAANPREAAARSLTIRTLLRQRAAVLEIEGEDEAAALEALLEKEIPAPTVSEEEVLRYFEGNRQKFRSGDLFEARHILFETVRSTDKTALTRKAEGILLNLKDHIDHFEDIAKAESSCTSAQLGGRLGQLSLGSVVPEFWSALVNFGKTGLLPHLVETRFGHHIVLVDRCAMGQPLPFEAVQAKVREYLVSRLSTVTYQQYIAHLIEQSVITGINLADQRPQPAGPGLPLE